MGFCPSCSGTLTSLGLRVLVRKMKRQRLPQEFGRELKRGLAYTEATLSQHVAPPPPAPAAAPPAHLCGKHRPLGNP